MRHLQIRLQKEDLNCTHITIVGNCICYPGDTGMKMGLLNLVKLLLNSVLLCPDGNFLCFDISKFYLGTLLDRPKYVGIKQGDIPQEVIDKYNLTTFTTMVGYTSKSTKVYTLNKLAYSPTTSSLKALPWHPWILSMPHHTRPVEAPMATNPICPHCR